MSDYSKNSSNNSDTEPFQVKQFVPPPTPITQPEILPKRKKKKRSAKKSKKKKKPAQKKPKTENIPFNRIDFDKSIKQYRAEVLPKLETFKPVFQDIEQKGDEPSFAAMFLSTN